ncbi:host attachment protein [Alicycliphilus denitrificans]|uniref:host attachment protein n=1 Tax=Alicycliphilus denitrificans TaxID=179636 RepID=UPI00384ED40A
MDKPIWVIVANGSMARLLERNPAKPEGWVEKECLTHPQSRLHGAEAGQEPSGHSIAGRSGLAPRSEPHDHERRKFAQQVAHAVKGAVGGGQGGALVVFASNPFLGELLDHLDDTTRKWVSASHPLDLTGLGLAELIQRMHGEFGL